MEIINDMISVIMPVYNGENYLKESIESILNQSYKNFEFIIINDGSVDYSSNIIKKYMEKDDRIIFIDRKNKGLVESLNDGIRLAKGEYIARMDCDDISLDKRFEKQVKFLVDNPSIDIVGAYIEVIGDKSNSDKVEAWFNQKWSNNESLLRSTEGSIIAHPTAMIRSRVIKELKGYRNLYSRMEDDDLWVRCLKCGSKIDIIDEQLLKYRIHNNSKSVRDISDFEKYTYEKIRFKLDNFLNEDEIEKYSKYIWGCGKGGEITARYFKKINLEFEGFIDSYKTGMIENKKIYNKKVLKDKKNTFVFIATEIGLSEVKTELKKLNINSYIYIL